MIKENKNNNNTDKSNWSTDNNNSGSSNEQSSKWVERGVEEEHNKTSLEEISISQGKIIEGRGEKKVTTIIQ